jgi:hypothetical protein
MHISIAEIAAAAVYFHLKASKSSKNSKKRLGSAGNG